MNTKNKKINENIEKYGQYYTTHPSLKDKIYEFILNKPMIILEPCIGQGDLVKFVTDKNPDIKFDMYEIDKNIKLLKGIKKDKVKYGDFLISPIKKKYKTIIGNPPYIRTKKGNLYIDFIVKCYNLLEANGELIFVVPSDFLKLTSMAHLLDTMMKNGTFSHIYHPNDEHLFENASVNIMIFRYIKSGLSKKQQKTLYNNKILYISNNEGLITFNESKIKNSKQLNQLFNIYVGMVSGREQIFKNKKLGNVDIINGDGVVDKYVFIEKYPSNNKKINKYLEKNKKELMDRKIRKFNETNWFEWGALRNIKAVKLNKGKKCIFIHTLTRKKKVAFLGKVDYYGGGLIMLLPKVDMKIEDLNKVVLFLNSEVFKMNYMFAGRFKVGHRQLSGTYYSE